MKKTIIVILCTVLIASFGITISASGGNGRGNGNNGSGGSPNLEERKEEISQRKAQNDEKLAQVQNKRQEYQAFHRQLQEQRREMIENRRRNTLLTAETNQLRLRMMQTINALYNKGATIPAATVQALEEYLLEINKTMLQLKETKGDIQDVLWVNRTHIKNRDYAKMDLAFAEIRIIQQWRYEQLMKINTILQQMNALIEASVTTAT